MGDLRRTSGSTMRLMIGGSEGAAQGGVSAAMKAESQPGTDALARSAGRVW
jgi:hypothetical protein